MKNAIALAALFVLAACGDNGSSAPAAASGAETVAPALEEADALAAGRRAFNECAVCHSAREGDGHRVGPNLYGVVGRPAGKAEGFTYSSALAAADFVWDREKLDAFIASPRDYLPGNRMAYFGNDDAAERAALIGYLASLSGE